MEREKIAIPKFDLHGEVAVVTGGTKGIGHAIASTFAAYGADVAVVSRTEKDCKNIAEELAQNYGVNTIGIAADVTNADSVKHMVQEVVEKMGKLSIMVCNAGSASTVRALEMAEEDWDKVINVDLKGVFLTAQAAARSMVEQKTPGKIIAIASVAGLVGNKGISHYCAAKGGVVNLVRALALEFAPYQINVNCICPGYIATAINDYGFRSNPKVAEKMISKSMIQRFGTPEEVAACALLLASSNANYTTAAAYLVDGGTAAW